MRIQQLKTPITTAALIFILTTPLSGLNIRTGEKEFPEISAGMELTGSLKVENSGRITNVFDNLIFRGEIRLSPYSRFSATVDMNEIAYKSGWSSDSSGSVFQDRGFDQSLVQIESDVLQEAGLSSAVNLNLLAAYGSHQEILVMDETRFRFERSSTSGIDGFNLHATLGLNKRFFFTGAFNPRSLENIGKSDYPDVFAAFYMDNDHRGSSWGPLIHFTSSSMQLFYDSSSNLENNRLYDNPGSAMTLGIGGTLLMDFAGIEILGFGMTEYFLMNDRNNPDIIQAEWCAGFGIPLLSGIKANLSGSNAIFLSETGDGSYMNFGLDVQAMFTDIFGIFGAVAGIGILDEPGMSAEAGLCLVFRHFEMYTGYSDHAIGTDAGYAKGAFDKVELIPDGTEAPGGGFFFTLKSAF
jgi:hypothetical protein